MAKRKISFIVTDSGNINAVCKGKAYAIPYDHANYEKIKQALIEDNEEDFANQADVAKAVAQFTAAATADNIGEVTVKDGQVYWKGEVVHGAVADRILMLMNKGFPFEPMMKFMENLLKNPSYRAVNELYTFLDRVGLPITEDGCFLGYKRVRADFTDCRTGNFSNVVGNKLEMPRNTVDDNWRLDCSSGFHVGSIDYVRNFCANEENHVVIVKVNPADVVSVPSETNKLRTCKYEVLSEYDKKLLTPMQSTLHTNAGVAVDSQKIDTFRSWEELDTDEEEDVFDSDLDDEDDSELDVEEETVTRLTAVAEDIKIDPYRLAYRLNIEVGEHSTLRQIISEALYDYQSEQFITDQIVKQ